MTPGLISRAEDVRAPSRRGGAIPSAMSDWPLSSMPRMLLAVAVLALLCLACGAVADVPVARFASTASPSARRIASLFSALGDSGYMLVISGLLAIMAYGLRRRFGRFGVTALLGERAVFVFSTVAGSGLLAQLIKHLVGRARPKLLDTMGAFHFDVFSIKASLASFPSGHTASAFGLALALGLMERRLAPVLLGLAILVGAARVMLGAHYLSDVVAGAALGSAVTLTLAAVFARRRFAFEDSGGRIRLKGDGAILAGLRALRSGSGRAA